MKSNPVKLGALLGFFAVAIGAFGKHALESRIESHYMAIYEIGVRYQFYATLVILAIAALAPQLNPKRTNLCVNFFFYGSIIFSGSLYLLAIFQKDWFGAITPLGGICFLAGFAVLFFAPRTETTAD